MRSYLGYGLVRPPAVRRPPRRLSAVLLVFRIGRLGGLVIRLVVGLAFSQESVNLGGLVGATAGDMALLTAQETGSILLHLVCNRNLNLESLVLAFEGLDNLGSGSFLAPLLSDLDTFLEGSGLGEGRVGDPGGEVLPTDEWGV